VAHPTVRFLSMKRIFSICFVTTFLLQACTGKKLNNETGHWHSYSGDGTYSTLDISDSISITDNDVFSGIRLEIPRKDKFGNGVLPGGYYGHETHSNRYYVLGDSLIIQDFSGSVQKYIRADVSGCHITHKYLRLNVEINLEEKLDGINYYVSDNSYCTNDLFIGKPKKKLVARNEIFARLSRSFPDSTYIQTGDVFIGLAGISQFCKHLTNNCVDSPMPLNVNLHADRDVPSEFLRKVESMIEDSFRVHKVVLVQGKDLGLIQRK
jgi:hypothetical protein